MARRLGVSSSTIKRSLKRWKGVNLLLEFWRPGLLPKLRITFHPFDRNAITRARRAVRWHQRDLGDIWMKRALRYLVDRTRRIEASRQRVRRSYLSHTRRGRSGGNLPTPPLPVDAVHG
jgi:hypothetical protein